MGKVNYEVQIVETIQEFFSYAQKGYFELKMTPFLKKQILNIFQAKDYFKENELLWYAKLLLDTNEEKNVLFAKEILKDLSNEHHPMVGVILGEYYYQIHHMPLAFGYFLLAAHRKDPKAEYFIGKFYQDGIELKPNKRLARHWLKRSSDQGYILADYALAEFYYRRKKPCVRLAKKYVKRAVNAHLFKAYDLLGTFYLEGFGYKKNEKKAFALFLEAAEHQELAAMYHLGHCYKLGLGTQRNDKAMLYWYKKAAEHQEVHALYELGMCYLWGIGTLISYPKAYGYFKRGKELGSNDCILEFARLYEEGKGVEKDQEKAFKTYLELAKQDDIKGLFELGRCFYYGIGTKKDLNAAIIFLLKGRREGVIGAEKLVRLYYRSYKAKEQEEKPTNLIERVFVEKANFIPLKIKNLSGVLSNQPNKKSERT